MMGHYTESDIVQALRSVGVRPGDTLFSHVSLLPLGFLIGVSNASQLVLTFKRAIASVLGPTGCLITPSYSYSFCKGESYNPSTTPSDCGPFSNHLMKLNDVQRTNDPIFSVLGFGSVSTLFDNLPNNSFGDDCLYERLLARNTKIVNIGLSLFYLTAIHFLEKQLNVSYRYDKQFSGIRMFQGNWKETSWTYYVRNLGVPSEPDCSELQNLGMKYGLVTEAKIGLGTIISAPMQPYFDLARECVANDPWFLTINAKWRKSKTHFRSES